MISPWAGSVGRRYPSTESWIVRAALSTPRHFNPLSLLWAFLRALLLASLRTCRRAWRLTSLWVLLGSLLRALKLASLLACRLFWRLTSLLALLWSLLLALLWSSLLSWRLTSLLRAPVDAPNCFIRRILRW